MSGPVSVAVVGLGFGRAHVYEALRLDSVRLAAVVELTDPREDHRLLGDPARDQILAVPHFRSLEDLLAHDVPDIVALATPIHTHAALAELALRAGAHVLLEKPPTATLSEHRRLLSIARESRRAVQVGFQARGGGGVDAVRRAVEAGAVGDVIRIAAVGRWVRRRGYYRRAAWAGRRSLGGVPVMDGALTNPFAHAVDIALALDGAFAADDVTDVTVDAWHAHDIEADDTTSVIIRTTSGTEIAVALTLCAENEELSPTVRVIGTDGEIRLHYTEDRVEWPASETGRPEKFARASLLENLAAHVTHGSALIAPLERTGAFMSILEASRDAAAPRRVPPVAASWVGIDDEARPIVHGVDEWCERVAASGMTFTQLGAPWTTAPLPAPAR